MFYAGITVATKKCLFKGNIYNLWPEIFTLFALESTPKLFTTLSKFTLPTLWQIGLLQSGNCFFHPGIISKLCVW